MLVTGITDEDFVNYKLPSMFISTATCSFKCDKECGKQICQNSALAKVEPIYVADDEIVRFAFGMSNRQNRRWRKLHGLRRKNAKHTGKE